MAVFDKDTIEVWNNHAKRQINEGFALTKLWQMRDDALEDTTLFLVPLSEMPDAEVGKRFSVEGCEYEIKDIDYEHLFVRELCQ